MISYLIAVVALAVLACVATALWRVHVGHSIYTRAVSALGEDKVLFVNRAFELFTSIFKKPKDSLVLFKEKLRERPDTKLMVVSLMQTVYILVCDPDIIRAITVDYHKQTPKWTLLIFEDQLDKGLLFSKGEEWKKSRNILSGLFHFGLLKKREHTMYEVVSRHIGHLDRENVDLFRLGCDIGGETVVETLFGKEFTKVRFGSKTPLEEAQDIINQFNKESMKPLYVLRVLLFGPITKESQHLTASQEKLRDRLLRLKSVGAEYLQQQRVKKDKGEEVPPFVEAYLNLHHDSYMDEMVQQLVLFLIAGQDTTGQLIETCLYALAEYPEYQQRLFDSLQNQDTDVHTNKQLNNFIQETNRLYGPLRFSLVRQVSEPFTIEGFEFKNKQKIRLGFGPCMTNVKYFDQPDRFLPERFEKPFVHPHAFTPFSGGAHNCIGQHMAMMEVRIALAEILKLYRLERTNVPLKMFIRPVITTPVYHNLVKFVRKSPEPIK